MKKIICVTLSILFALSICVFAKPAEKTYADGFNGSTFLYNQNERVSYYRKVESETVIPSDIPKYYSTTANANDCVPVAGAIVLGYYDRYFDNLIPNFTAGMTIRDIYIYNPQNAYVSEVINSLFVLMETNSSGSGTTISQFQNGMQQYVQSKNRTIEFESVKNGSFSAEEVTDAIDDEMPIVIFVSGYALVDQDGITSSGNTDTFAKKIYGGAHAMVVSGIKTITYYNQYNVVVSQKILLRVSDGFSSGSTNYVMVYGFGNIDNAYSVNIY